MKIAVIVQARMTSTRLPGKVLLPVLGRPLIQYLIERLRRCREVNEIVIAVTTRPTDDPLVRACEGLGVRVFRGAEDDVLARYHGAAERVAADAVVRVTSDCPLIDPQVVDSVVRRFVDQRAVVDYVSNALTRTYPRGMDCEIFPFRVLDEAHRQATAGPDREHVTPFIYRQPERFRLANVAYGQDMSHHRWTVDTPEDLALIERILGALYPTTPEFTLEDCLALVAEHPDWSLLNAHVEQKLCGQ